MSGIVAVYCLDGRPAERGLVSAMLDAAAYRGPDGLNSWIDGPVGLGHAMLRTTPEAVGESQPLIDEQAGLALTMDGRIDNRDELKELLERQGLRPVGNTDAEIVLRAYQCWGEESPAKILGDFAFALWDGRKHQTILRPRLRQRAAIVLLLRRPQFHLRLRTAADPGRAERAARARRDGGRRVPVRDTDRTPPPRSTATSVSSKAAARCSATGQDRSAPLFRHRPGKENPLSHRRGIRRAFRVAVPGGGAMQAAQRRRGGGRTERRSRFFDWSSGPRSACFAKALSPVPRFETFSLRFDDPEADERGFIGDVAAMWGLETNWSPPFYAKFADYLAEIRRYRYLSVRPNSVMDTLMHRAMREHGFRVVLTGQGGDQWFGGSPDCFADLLCGFRFVELFRLLRGEAAHPTGCSADKGPLALLIRRTLWPLVPPEPKFLINRMRGVRLMPPYVKPEFARRLDLERVRNTPTRQRRGLDFSQRTMYQVLNLGISILFAEMNERECALAGLGGQASILRPPDNRVRFRHPGGPAMPAACDQIRHARGGIATCCPNRFANVARQGRILRLAPPWMKEVAVALGGDAAFGSFDVVERGWVDPEQLRRLYRAANSRSREQSVAALVGDGAGDVVERVFYCTLAKSSFQRLISEANNYRTGKF